MKLGELERLMGFLFTGDVWRHQKPQGYTVLSSHNQWSRKFLQPCKPCKPQHFHLLSEQTKELGLENNAFSELWNATILPDSEAIPG